MLLKLETVEILYSFHYPMLKLEAIEFFLSDLFDVETQGC
jgi:hypothetical protein